MSFKWSTRSIQITCPKCGCTEEYSVDNIDVDSEPEENSDYKMGPTYRHIARIYWHCPSCDRDFEAEIEFIEYPEGQCECVNIVEGALLAGYSEDSLMSMVDFSLD